MRPNLTHELLVPPGDVRFAQTPTKGKLLKMVGSIGLFVSVAERRSLRLNSNKGGRESRH
ncbi:MAG: hypothetical protein U0Y10_10510 [Spirosomataceae bacterium]